MREPDIKDFQAFLDEFQSETDRGAALVGAALIDFRLREILRAFMVSNNAAEELLNGTGAPLGTLASRISAAFALGLIDADEKHEFNIIRAIRNEIAHSALGTTFDDLKIRTLSGNLKSKMPIDMDYSAKTPRFLFLHAVILAALTLTYRTERIEKEKRQTKAWTSF